MIKRTFRWTEGSAFHHKFAGWFPTWLSPQEADPFVGNLAHDILEHNKADGLGLISELKATGAMSYIRGETGLLSQINTRSGEEHAAANIESVYNDFIDCNVDDTESIFRHGAIPKLGKYSDDGESFMNETINIAHKNIVHERLSYNDDFQSMEAKSLENEDITKFVAAAKYWMFVGYKQAVNRWEKWGGGNTAMYLYMDINRLTDKLQDGDVYEGKMLTVSADPRRCRVTVDTNDSQW